MEGEMVDYHQTKKWNAFQTREVYSTSKRSTEGLRHLSSTQTLQSVHHSAKKNALMGVFLGAILSGRASLPGETC